MGAGGAALSLSSGLGFTSGAASALTCSGIAGSGCSVGTKAAGISSLFVMKRSTSTRESETSRVSLLRPALRRVAASQTSSIVAVDDNG